MRLDTLAPAIDRAYFAAGAMRDPDNCESLLDAAYCLDAPQTIPAGSALACEIDAAPSFTFVSWVCWRDA